MRLNFFRVQEITFTTNAAAFRSVSVQASRLQRIRDSYIRRE
jgi:hypothetical protein